MNYILTTQTEKELYHHGVKGMKWGVRRYQDKSGRLTSLGKQHRKEQKSSPDTYDYAKIGKAKVNELVGEKDLNLMKVRISKGKEVVERLSGLMSAHDFEWQEVTNYGDGLIPPAKVIKDYPDAHKSKSEYVTKTHEDFHFTQSDLERCNPGHGDPGTNKNCAKCSATLEMRLRGYDVSAGRQNKPSLIDAQALWFKDAERVDYNYDDVESALKAHGPKTSGVLTYRYPGGVSGHAVHWTNDVDGRFQIQDGQNGKTFDSVSQLMDTYGGDKKESIATFRLDNCEPNLDAMAQDSVIRRDTIASKVRHKREDIVRDTWR